MPPSPENTPLTRLSQRLWGPTARRETTKPLALKQLIRDDEARSFANTLRVYGEGRRRVPLRTLASRLGKDAPDELAEQAAAFLITGVLALGALEDQPPGVSFEALIQGAFGLDDASRELRDRTLSGLEDWPDFPDGGPPLPPIGENCLAGMLEGAARAGRFVQSQRGASAVSSVDANGIASIVPSKGSAGDVVQIRGAFPAPQPQGRFVLLPRAGGGTLQAELTGAGWGASVIEVAVPEPPGDGPVGFATSTDTGGGGGDPTALIEFSDALTACLGPRAAGVAGRLNHVPPGTIMSPRQPVPTLPGGVNLFHGGPVLTSVSAMSGSELDQPFTVTGLNLESGDAVYLDSTRCQTTFVSPTTLRFSVPAIVSGHKLLRIGRGYRRSNGTSFDVQATLQVPTPPPRIQPGASVTLKGTGFGQTLTATVDGVDAHSYVVDTHTIQVRLTRPARTPLPNEKRGERVTVELFDGYRSIGTAPALVAAFRIATFGDSIVWGQGLLPPQRFPSLVAATITARQNRRIAVYTADHCAHSGAVVVIAGEPLNTAIPRPANVFTGECPNAGASITGQVNAWPTRFPTELSEIDLVIIDGGINDVRISNILDPSPTASDTALAARTTALCDLAMRPLLLNVLATFPSARVVVTGYYPIVSMSSDVNFLIPLIGSLGLLAGVVTTLVSFVPGVVPIGFGLIESALIQLWIRARLSTRSAVFSATANTALASAVTATTAAAPTRRIALAVPQFGPDNAIFAPDSFLYGVTSALTAEDPVAPMRMAACGSDPITDIASIGHPNAKGAQAYADAITAVLPALGL